MAKDRIWISGRWHQENQSDSHQSSISMKDDEQKLSIAMWVRERWLLVGNKDSIRFISTMICKVFSLDTMVNFKMRQAPNTVNETIVSPSPPKADMLVNIGYFCLRYSGRLETLNSTERDTQLHTLFLRQLDKGTFPTTGPCQVLKEMSNLVIQQCVSTLPSKHC